MFKIGDKVRVREDLQPYKLYTMKGNSGGVAVAIGSMLNYRGKTVTIAQGSNLSYLIAEDDGCWIWVDGMFETLKTNRHAVEVIRKKKREV